MAAGTIVVGGGLFGVTTALALARLGRPTTVVERHPELLSGASGVNQYRVHRGFHYPRSPETVASCLAVEERFRSVFGAAIIDDDDHYYAVAKQDSRLTAEQYLGALDRVGLTWQFDAPPFLRKENVECCIRVAESAVDLARLRLLCRRLLDEAGVRVRLNTSFDWSQVTPADTVVLATYADNNRLLHRAGLPAPPYRYQVAELLCVELPPAYRKASCLVMDGAFPSLDPCGRSGHHVVGHVTLMHHAEATAVVSPFRGTAEDRRRSPQETWALLAGAGASFYTGLSEARILQSRMVTRMTLPDVTATDARPTVVEQVDERVFTVFSGKLTTCIAAADDLVALVTS